MEQFKSLSEINLSKTSLLNEYTFRIKDILFDKTYYLVGTKTALRDRIQNELRLDNEVHEVLLNTSKGVRVFFDIEYYTKSEPDSGPFDNFLKAVKQRIFIFSTSALSKFVPISNNIHVFSACRFDKNQNKATKTSVS